MTAASKWPVFTPPLTLGVRYDKGESVPQDDVQAHKGDADAQNIPGLMYNNGRAGRPRVATRNIYTFTMEWVRLHDAYDN